MSSNEDTAPSYPSNMFAKGKGRGKSSVKKSDVNAMQSCAMQKPISPTQMPPPSPYCHIKQSPISYQDISPVVDIAEPDFNAYNGNGQQDKIDSARRPMAFNNINIERNDSINNIMNNMQANNMNNIQGNRMISNSHAKVNISMANLNLNTTLPPTPAGNTVAPGSSESSPTMTPFNNIKRSVSERYNGTFDSGEQLAKREKPTPIYFEFLNCDLSPAYEHLNEPFNILNVSLQVHNDVRTSAAGLLDEENVNVNNPALINDVFVGNSYIPNNNTSQTNNTHFNIWQDAANMVVTEEAWYRQLLINAANDFRDDNTIRHDNVNLNLNNDDNLHLNMPQNQPNNNINMPNESNDVDNNIHIINDIGHYNIEQLDFPSVENISDELSKLDV